MVEHIIKQTAQKVKENQNPKNTDYLMQKGCAGVVFVGNAKKTDIRYSAMIESCLVCVDVTERSWKLRKRKNADRILQLR